MTAADIGVKAVGPLQIATLKWARDEGYKVGDRHGRTVYCKTFQPQPELGHYAPRKVCRKLSDLEAQYTRNAGPMNDGACLNSYYNQ